MQAEEIAMLIGASATFLVPLIAILVHHQRKMAELLHRGHQSQAATDSEVVHELRQIRQALQSQTIAFDNLASTLRRPNEAPGLSGRLEEARASHGQ